MIFTEGNDSEQRMILTISIIIGILALIKENNTIMLEDVSWLACSSKIDFRIIAVHTLDSVIL